MTLVVQIIAGISLITHKNPNKPSFNHNILAKTSNSVLVITAQVKLAMLITAPPNKPSYIHVTLINRNFVISRIMLTNLAIII